MGPPNLYKMVRHNPCATKNSLYKMALVQMDPSKKRRSLQNRSGQPHFQTPKIKKMFGLYRGFELTHSVGEMGRGICYIFFCCKAALGYIYIKRLPWDGRALDKEDFMIGSLFWRHFGEIFGVNRHIPARTLLSSSYRIPSQRTGPPQTTIFGTAGGGVADPSTV